MLYCHKHLEPHQMPNETRTREPKACQSCARAKVKCEPEAAGGCKRCLRLGRTCILQPPGAHKRKPQEPPTDVTRLEQKLDDMRAMFTETSQRLLDASLEKQMEHQSQQESPSSCPPKSLERIMPNDEEGIKILWSFRNEVTPFSPFVALHKDVTVSELREKKPFLLSTIAMVSCYDDASRQMEMAKIIKQHIATVIVLKEELSFDLLQGLLVCLLWCASSSTTPLQASFLREQITHRTLFRHHLQIPFGLHLGNLLHLAMSMMIDLGLHKKPGPLAKMAPIINQRRTLRRNMERTLDERRAYLGLFYMHCVTAMYLRDMDPMRYTSYTEECCRIIEDSKEYLSDLYLVQLVRMHRMTERINRVLTFDQYDPAELILSAPIGMCIKSLEAELRKIKESIASIALNDSILLLHYYTLELRLYEVALDEDFPTERYGNYPLARLNILYSCLTSARAFFETFSSIPLTEYFKVPYPVYASFFYAIGILSQLVLFSAENWDRDYARSIIDFPTAIDMSVGRLKEALDTHGMKNLRFPEAFARLLPRINILKDLHEIRRTAIENNNRSGKDSNNNPILLPRDFLQDINFLWPGDFAWQHILPD